MDAVKLSAMQTLHRCLFLSVIPQGNFHYLDIDIETNVRCAADFEHLWLTLWF